MENMYTWNKWTGKNIENTRREKGAERKVERKKRWKYSDKILYEQNKNSPAVFPYLHGYYTTYYGGLYYLETTAVRYTHKPIFFPIVTNNIWSF